MARKRFKRGLNKHIADGDLLKLTDGTSEIYIVPARQGRWQIVAPPAFTITTEPIPDLKTLDTSPMPAIDSTNRPE